MKPRKARSQSPTARRKRRTQSPPRVRRVSPRCKPNKKYTCNFETITTGKCPGYLVDRRRRETRQEAGLGQTRKVVYEMKWRPGQPQDAPIRSTNPRSGTPPATTPLGPLGYDFTSRRAINRGAAGLENDTQCLPRKRDGKIQPAAVGKAPNEYCQLYRGPTVRQQRGCVAKKRRSRQRIIVPRLSRSRSPSKSRSQSPPAPPAAPAAPAALASPLLFDQPGPEADLNWPDEMPDFLRGGGKTHKTRMSLPFKDQTQIE